MGKERNACRRSFLCLVQYGTRSKFSSFSCKDFFLTLELYVHAIFYSKLESVPCENNNICEAGECWRLISQELGWVHLAVSLQQENLETNHETDITIRLMHIHWKTKTQPLRVTVAQVELLTHVTQWNDNTNCQSTVPVVQKLTWGPSGLRPRHPTTKKNLPHWAFTCTFCLKLYNCWWKRQIDIITSTWIHWMKDGPHCVMWLFRKYVCFWQLLCSWGMIWGTCWKITGQH